LIPKRKNKPRSFTINSSFPSLSIDTSFSRLRKRKPSKAEIEFFNSDKTNTNEYYQLEDDPNLYSVYARNKILESIYNIFNDASTDTNTNYALEFSKSIEVQWFTYFINKNVSPVTVILVMKILTKLLQIQSYQYKITFRDTFKMYKLMSVNIPKFCKVYQIYHSLLALTFDTPISTIPMNATFDVITLKRLYKGSIQNNNNSSQYNTDSLLVFLKMVKEIILKWIDNANKNQDKINIEQIINLKTQISASTDNLSTANLHSSKNQLMSSMHDIHDSSSHLSLNLQKAQSSSLLPHTPLTPRTPRTPRTPLVNLSEKSKKRADIADLIENDTSLYIYQGNFITFYFIVIKQIY